MADEPARTDSDDPSIRLAFDAWKEINETIRKAVEFRWDVTKTFLTIMAAIVAAAAVIISRQSRVPGWLPYATIVLTLVALLPQLCWQHKYNRFIIRLIVESDRLAQPISQRIRSVTDWAARPAKWAAEGVHPLTSITGVATKDAKDGHRGIMAVSVIMTAGAMAVLLAFMYLPKPGGGTGSPQGQQAAGGGDGTGRVTPWSEWVVLALQVAAVVAGGAVLWFRQFIVLDKEKTDNKWLRRPSRLGWVFTSLICIAAASGLVAVRQSAAASADSRRRHAQLLDQMVTESRRVVPQDIQLRLVVRWGIAGRDGAEPPSSAKINASISDGFATFDLLRTRADNDLHGAGRGGAQSGARYVASNLMLDLPETIQFIDDLEGKVLEFPLPKDIREFAGSCAADVFIRGRMSNGRLGENGVVRVTLSVPPRPSVD